MPFVSRIGAALASTLILLAPAIWNRFPLLQYDTGGYLARWFEGYLVPSRSTVFGLFLNLFAQPDFWPVVVIQAALTVWVLALVLRALGFGGRPLLLHWRHRGAVRPDHACRGSRASCSPTSSPASRCWRCIC